MTLKEIWILFNVGKNPGSQFHLEAQADYGVAKGYMEDVIHRERRCFSRQGQRCPTERKRY